VDVNWAPLSEVMVAGTPKKTLYELKIINKTKSSYKVPVPTSVADPEPDLDPLVQGTDPDPVPDPFIVKQNSKKNLDSYCLVTSL
jgi:hypothetical protein